MQKNNPTIKEDRTATSHKHDEGARVDFDFISLKLASPEKILKWSYGEVTKPETINYRTQRSEKGGLFDEKIFGPDKDYECYCGRYKGIRYKGIVCEKCGVEITRSIVRRERMGHIELASPVSHIWFLKSIPSRIALVLDINMGDLRKVIYFAGYIVTKVNEEERKRILKEVDSEFKIKIKKLLDTKTKTKIKELLVEVKKNIDSIQEGVVFDEILYNKYSFKYGAMFEAGIGAESIYDICKTINLVELKEQLEKDLEKAGSIKKIKLNKRLALISSMIESGVRPEWMFLSHIPVIPPALRPMVVLSGGRHATSDVNDLYRRVINRNNRLKKLLEINAPDVILRNEKRILQEAVDSLIDNSIRYTGTGGAMSQYQRRPLKSLADNLKGKQGLFRQNLLGKRVDYSGRSVIVVGPHLDLDQCGLPKRMALELFKPFVISRILKDELAHNIKWANRLIDEKSSEVWAILEDVIKNKYVLLNRAPTLHRLGIQAFKPLLIEGKSIQVHPLVCAAFNADFDGDMMAVHLPLTKKAQIEAKEIMTADKNILKPGTGEPIVEPKLDMTLGCYWMTKIKEGSKGEGKYFSSVNEAITNYDFGELDLKAKINILAPDHEKYSIFNKEIFETTVGRLLFNSILPKDYPFINEVISKKDLSNLTYLLIEKYGINNISSILGKIKDFGFKYSTKSGITWGIDNIMIPEDKEKLILDAKKKSTEIWSQYNEGLLTKEERHRKNIEIWHNTKDDLEKLIPETLDENGSAYNMWNSGARGSLGQFTQMAGMRGLIQNTSGETIEFPVISCLKEGLTPIEYFTTTHGSRKGLADTALNTAKAGYLTRKLFDVAQDVVILEEDCKTKEYIILSKENISGIEISLSKNINGRVLAKDVEDKKGKVLFKKGHLLTKNDAKIIEEMDVEEVAVKSPMTCKTSRGICQKCYGVDLGTNQLIDLGEAVGTIAAQAIGEPGTQLTMRTFHTGGTASVGGDITQGLPRVEEIFEKRSPKIPAIVSKIDGEVTSVIENESEEKKIIILPDIESRSTGTKSKQETEYILPYNRMSLVKVGDKIKKGDVLTDGSVDISELFKYAGKEKTQEYIIKETIKIYELQGAATSRKHVEVIIKQMLSRRKIKSSGDTNLSVGAVVEDSQLRDANAKVKDKGLTEAKAEQLALGITEVSLSRNSFLSSVSFQNTTKMLINASLRGAEDKMLGLKENVIVGRLVPAGSGFKGSKKWKMVQGVKEDGENVSENED
ncbi:MAG: DNA-directed RNA polymerase subunit beta' [Candidatus Pacebacteria bacterium]|nr:DNA-directed RNA polymerase subunit beta' [Candidatus Paceibacterota bacterium]